MENKYKVMCLASETGFALASQISLDFHTRQSGECDWIYTRQPDFSLAMAIWRVLMLHPVNIITVLLYSLHLIS